MSYKVITYPDGQLNIQIERSVRVIKERINSYADLFKIKSIKEASDHAYKDGLMHLWIPCMFGQRSDRRFTETESFGLKLITDFINSCNFTSVTIVDPHSDVCLALINNSVKKSSFEYVQETIDIVRNYENNLVLVSPDAGAYKKVFKYGEDFNLSVVAANKYRALDGSLQLTFVGDVAGKNCLIVDDLLDGGYTFHLLAESLKAQGADKVYLYITHAYFNKGVDFTEHIDHFYCTNSVKDIEHPKVTQYKII